MVLAPLPPAKKREAPKVEAKEKPPAVLDAKTGASTPVVPLHDVIVRIVALAQALSERKFYPYQVQFSYRLIESLLLRDGETITALLARQSGKTEGLAATIVALLIMLPILANKYPDDWRFNLTDDSGRYRGFNKGVKIGIYAPKLSQAEIMFLRVRGFLETKTAIKILSELGLTLETSNGDTIKISSGSRLLCQTASENAKIEGETHHCCVVEEAQDVGDLKIKKSLSPMVSSTKGTMVMIGTASTKRCTFYEQIKTNERFELSGHKRNHFFYPHDVCSRYNSLYRDYIEQEKLKIGEFSDEFKMSYACEWLFERGMFVTQAQLFNKEVALCSGQLFSVQYGPDKRFKLPSSYSVVLGIDWGRDHDSTVLTAVAVDWSAPYQTFSNNMEQVGLYRRHLIDWKEWHGDNYEIQFHEIQAYCRAWGAHLRRIVTDSNTCGKPIFDRLVSVYADTGIEVMPFNFSSKTKSDGYKAFYGEICGKRFTFPADKSLRGTNEYRRFVNQMLDLRKSYKQGLMVVNHPDEAAAHDDYTDSAAMAVWGTLFPTTAMEIDFQDTNVFMR